MSFQALEFLPFLALTAAVCLLLGRRDRRRGQRALLAACLVFYVSGGGWGALAVLAAGTAVSALALRNGGKAALTGAAGYHILVLLIFKYTGFLTGGRLALPWSPLGLSFFTFQQLWLLKAFSGDRFRPEKGDSLPLYALFFPTVVSGPILKPEAFFPQVRAEGFLRPKWKDVSAGLYAFSLGLAKKTLLADNLAKIVSNGWALGADLTAPAAWTVILGYTLRLYFDFSGYCDMAAGCARLLGLRLPKNFDSPYRSLSVGEFWKRWHITLTGFLRECLYFPLGGSRKGLARTCCNILLVFLVSGLWHGAGWTFLVWGALHGLAQAAERLWGDRRDRLPRVLRWGLTFLFVNFAWVFFQAPSLSAAFHLLAAAVRGGRGFPAEALAAGVLDGDVTAIATLFPAFSTAAPLWVLAGLLGGGLLAALWPRNTAEQMDRFRPSAVSALVCGVLLAWSVLSGSGVQTFIYANF